MKFAELMKRTLATKSGLAGLILGLGGMAGVYGLAASAYAQSVPPFVVMALALVSMAGTRMLTAAMNRVRMEHAAQT